MDVVERITYVPCEVMVVNATDPPVAARTEQLGIVSLPGVSIEGKVANMAHPDEALRICRAATLGQESER